MRFTENTGTTEKGDAVRQKVCEVGPGHGESLRTDVFPAAEFLSLYI